MQPCALALILLLDISGSVEAEDWQRQVEGHARAFQSEFVADAINRSGGVAVRVVAFAGNENEIVGWTVLNSVDTTRQFAYQMRARGSQMLPAWNGTLTAAAIESAQASFSSVPCEPERRVIDVVTDGVSQDRVRMERIRDGLIADEIQLNALFVETFTGTNQSTQAGYESGLRWLEEEVITPDGFATSVDGWTNFITAVRRKIILEMTWSDWNDRSRSY